MKSASGSAHGLQDNLLAASHRGFGIRDTFHRQRNPDVAGRVGNTLIDRVSILENFPFVGSAYAKRPDVRKLVSSPYIIYYRPRLEGNCVDILRYWHGARGEPEL
jgi:plasmid stabilization system protein ParE